MKPSRREIPRSLYKYFGPERTDVLSSSRVRYTPLGAFNDPFEGRPEITSLGSPETVDELLAEGMHQEAHRMYEMLDPRAKKMLSKEVWISMVKNLSEEKKPQILSELQRLAPYAKEYMLSKYDEHVGAFCLSEVPDSLLMWSHYGASHTGFLIEYDAHHPHFHEQVDDDDELRHIRRVQYREARPSLPASEIVGTDLFLVKSGHWSYEREWRVLRPLADADCVLSTLTTIHLFDVPTDAIKSIIFGCRCSAPISAKIKESIEYHGGYPDIHFKRMVADSSHFLLKITNI